MLRKVLLMKWLKMNDILELWKKLGDIPVNDDELIQEPFLDFVRGTNRHDIWHWFEDEFSVRVADLMFQMPEGDTFGSLHIGSHFLYHGMEFEKISWRTDKWTVYNATNIEFCKDTWFAACTEVKNVS